MTPCKCKVSTALTDEQREWVEGRLRKPQPGYRNLEMEIKSRFGVTMYAKSLLGHKKNHMSAEDDEWAVEVEETYQALRLEMLNAPLLYRPAYLTVLANMRGLADGTASQQSLLQAIKLLSDLLGKSGDREGLVEYAVAAAEQRRSAAGASAGRGADTAPQPPAPLSLVAPTEDA